MFTCVGGMFFKKFLFLPQKALVVLHYLLAFGVIVNFNTKLSQPFVVKLCEI